MEDGLVKPTDEGVPQGGPLGLFVLHAQEGAGNGSKGPWRMSKTPPLSKALSNAYFRSLGLPELKCKVTA